MKFSTRTDIQATPDVVFQRLSDFPKWEAAARERGAEVSRLDASSTPETAHWRIGFDFRGKRRRSEARVIDFEPGQQIAIRGDSDGLAALVKVELVETGNGHTRMHSSIDLTPETIKARLLVQSLKLAKGTLERRLTKRLQKFGHRVERS